MTKQQMISLGVLALVAEGFDPVEALKMICGADKVDQMISDLYLQLRGGSVTPASALALSVLKVTEGNIRSQWAAAGGGVFHPFQIWLDCVLAAISELEAEK